MMFSPENAVVKASAVAEDMLVYSGKAKCFSSEESAVNAIMDGKIVEGDVVSAFLCPLIFEFSAIFLHKNY